MNAGSACLRSVLCRTQNLPILFTFAAAAAAAVNTSSGEANLTVSAFNQNL